MAQGHFNVQKLDGDVSPDKFVSGNVASRQPLSELFRRECDEWTDFHNGFIVHGLAGRSEPFPADTAECIPRSLRRIVPIRILDGIEFTLPVTLNNQ